MDVRYRDPIPHALGRAHAVATDLFGEDPDRRIELVCASTATADARPWTATVACVDGSLTLTGRGATAPGALDDLEAAMLRLVERLVKRGARGLATHSAGSSEQVVLAGVLVRAAVDLGTCWVEAFDNIIIVGLAEERGVFWGVVVKEGDGSEERSGVAADIGTAKTAARAAVVNLLAARRARGQTSTTIQKAT